MAPQKPMTSPFGLFMAKMKRLDTSLKSQPMSAVVSKCNEMYLKLDPIVKKRFESLSSHVKREPLNHRDLNRLLDAIDVEDNNNNEDNWDQMSASAPQVDIGFNYSRREDIAAINQTTDGPSDSDDMIDFERVKQWLQRMPDLYEKTIVCICFNVVVVTQDGEHYPNEIGLTQFSLKDGLKKCYTKLIRNPIPEGYYSVAKDFSETSHKIPIDSGNYESFVGDYRKLFREIHAFLSESGLTVADNDDRKMIFCKTVDRNGCENQPQVMGCLKWFDQQMYGKIRTKGLLKDFVVFDISELLFVMTQRYCETVRPKALCIDDMSKSKYDYSPDMNCENGFHSDMSNTYCALGVAKGLAYLFVDSMFGQQFKQDLDIKPNSNHKPKEQEITSHKTTLQFNTQALIANSRRGFRYHSDSPSSIEFEPNGDSPSAPDPNEPTTKNPLRYGLGRGRLRQNLKKSKHF